LYDGLSDAYNDIRIHHGNTGIEITPAQFMKGSFMLVFDLTPDGCPSTVTQVSPTTATSASNSNSTRLSPRP
jgi:hypothetical protein